MRTTKRSVATVVLAAVVMVAAACIPPPEPPKPQLTLPANITVEATSASGAVVTFTATATDRDDGPLPVTCNPASGSVFPVGTTVVRCSATNSAGGTRNGRFEVTVTPLGGTTTTTLPTTTTTTTTTTLPTTTTTTTTLPTTTTTTTTLPTTTTTTTTTLPTTTTASTTTTTQPPGTVPGISAGYNHTCAIRTDGTLSCWGANGQGQVGTTTNLVTRFLVPSPVMNLTNVSAVAAGGFHTCALSGGLVFCWGSSSYGQVGVGGAIPGSPVRTPTQVAGLSNVVSIAAGQFHTCAVRANGTMACWGDGFDGQLGTGIAGGSYATSVPVNVPGVNNAVEVTAGFGHTCIRRSNNTASCWGANNNGQLGDGTSSQDPVPSPVNVQLSNVTSIRAGFGFTCAIAGGQPSCWGENTNGNLGGSTLANESVDPLTIPLTALGGDVLDATVVSGGGDHACARRAAGTVRCWGLNGRGQHGTGNTLSSLIRNSDGQPVGYRQPIDIPDLTNVSALVTGEDHACVRRTNGSIACWGWNDSGQIGNNTRTTQLSPVNIAGF